MNWSAASWRRRRGVKSIAYLLALPAILVAVYAYGWFMNCEYIHLATLNRASRAQTPAGVSATEWISTRLGLPARPKWHHCGWCKTVYSHAEHFAVKVTISDSEAYLFDWDGTAGRLSPITLRTAEVFPELVPAGFVVTVLPMDGLDGQLQNDRPCRLIPKIPGSIARQN